MIHRSSCRRGATDKALQVAWRGLAYARRFKDRNMQGEMHYALARAYAVAAKSAPEQLQQAAAHLFIASQYMIANISNESSGLISLIATSLAS